MAAGGVSPFQGLSGSRKGHWAFALAAAAHFSVHTCDGSLFKPAPSLPSCAVSPVWSSGRRFGRGQRPRLQSPAWRLSGTHLAFDELTNEPRVGNSSHFGAFLHSVEQRLGNTHIEIC